MFFVAKFTATFFATKLLHNFDTFKIKTVLNTDTVADGVALQYAKNSDISMTNEICEKREK